MQEERSGHLSIENVSAEGEQKCAHQTPHGYFKASRRGKTLLFRHHHKVSVCARPTNPFDRNV